MEPDCFFMFRLLFLCMFVCVQMCVHVYVCVCMFYMSNVRALIKEKTNISVDMPDSTGKGGTSTNGNVGHTLSTQEENIKVLVSAVPEEFQDSLYICLSRSYVILKL